MTVSWDWVTTNNEVNTAHYELFPKDNIQWAVVDFMLVRESLSLSDDYMKGFRNIDAWAYFFLSSFIGETQWKRRKETPGIMFPINIWFTSGSDVDWTWLSCLSCCLLEQRPREDYAPGPCWWTPVEIYFVSQVSSTGKGIGRTQSTMNPMENNPSNRWCVSSYIPFLSRVQSWWLDGFLLRSSINDCLLERGWWTDADRWFTGDWIPGVSLILEFNHQGRTISASRSITLFQTTYKCLAHRFFFKDLDIIHFLLFPGE
jgi:hypothetical protein